MTKKDYELIANQIRVEVERFQALEDYHRAVGEVTTAEEYRENEGGAVRVADQLAQALRNENPRFDIDRFRRACKIGGGVETTHTCGEIPDYLK